MARGFLGGILTGGVMSAVVAGGASIWDGVVEGRFDGTILSAAGDASVVQLTQDSAIALPVAPQDTTPDGEAIDLSPAENALAALQQSETDTQETLDALNDVSPLEADQADAPQVSIPDETSEALSDTMNDTPDAQADVQQSDDIAAPDTSTNVSVPPIKDVTMADDVPTTVPESGPALDTQSATVPQTQAEGDTLVMPEMGDSAQVTPQADEAVLPSPTPTQPEAKPEQDSLSISTEPALPAPPAEDEAALSSVGSFVDRDDKMVSKRLPSVDNQQAEKAIDVIIEDDPRPVRMNAEPFENPEGRPEMAILLIDTGDSSLSVDALADFPYPLTFAVNALRNDAVDRMKMYRDKGFEVLAMTDLPIGASAQDAETTAAIVLEAMPGVIGLMEGDITGLQSSRAASDQITRILAETGHGLVLFPKGLNTAQKLASKEGVPSASVFRDFDSKGQKADVIRRFLDQAAFKAGQSDEGVIMLGRLRAETISALLLWGLQDRANRVALAPVSALLRPE